MEGRGRSRVAVIGGGPGGARCAQRLAEAGCAVTLFEPRTRFEKACGGGIPARGIERYPYLLDPRLPGKEIRECLLVAPSGREARFPLRDPLYVFSRADLHGFMLDRAVAAGAHWVRARVLWFRQGPGGWVVGAGGPRVAGSPGGESPAEVHAPFDFLVAADGAAGMARRKLSPGASRGNVAQGIGYYLPRVSEDFITLKFYAGLAGYLWVFPRRGHASAGICAPLGALPAADLKALMDRFLEARYPDGILERSESYAALIPGASADGGDAHGNDGGAGRDAPLVGDGWAVVGDAGRFVDPLTREGIYYAMESGDLLADALIAGKPDEYPDAWSRRFAPELSRAARVAARFFDTRFLERLVFLGGRSPAIARVLSDLIAGRQPYRSLKRRLVLTAPVIGANLVARALAPRAAGTVSRPSGGSRSTDR